MTMEQDSPSIDILKDSAITLLKKLIAIPSFSKHEDQTADIIQEYFEQYNISCYRLKNNVWAKNKFFSENKPTILLNSHHDTVKPNSHYSLDPFNPEVKDGKLYGLGSNDAGGALVSLISCFLYLYERNDLKYNIIIAASAEEEISGQNGIEFVLPELGDIFLGIVGEPTCMQMAVAEKGLLVIDCLAKGKSGHVAHDMGDNAIYKAIKDITWFQTFDFPRKSIQLGRVKMSVSMINAGIQHNIIPEICNYTVDIRTTDEYSHEEVLEIIKSNVSSEIKPRSMRLSSSKISSEHPVLIAAKELNMELFGSSTLSDQALMSFPTVKIGPGDSTRSHTADEFIYIDEIHSGIELYIKLLSTLNTIL